jgi:hypothetical protein
MGLIFWPWLCPILPFHLHLQLLHLPIVFPILHLIRLKPILIIPALFLCVSPVQLLVVVEHLLLALGIPLDYELLLHILYVVVVVRVRVDPIVTGAWGRVEVGFRIIVVVVVL